MYIYSLNEKNKETGLHSFKRLAVQKVDGLFVVVQESDRGFGAGVQVARIASIKPYKTKSGAEKAMAKYEPKTYIMSLYEGLVSTGVI